jgi:hypothetical protein
MSRSLAVLRLPALRPPSWVRLWRWREADGEAELRENRKNRRRGLHRFIGDADPARCASTPEQRVPHEAGETRLILECVPARLAAAPDTTEGYENLHRPNRSWSATSDQDRSHLTLLPTRLRRVGISPRHQRSKPEQSAALANGKS